MAEKVDDVVSREEFEHFKNATADMFDFIHGQHVAVLKHVNEQHVAVLSAVSAQNVQLLSLVKQHHDISHQRVLALQETFDNFTASVQAILGEPVTEPTTPSVN